MDNVISNAVDNHFYKKRLDIEEQIKTIATGPYGETIKKNHKACLYNTEVDDEYAYEDDNIKIIYTEKGYTSPREYLTIKKEYIVYYHNKLVYPKKYIMNPEWYQSLMVIYNKTVKKNNKIKLKEEKKKLEKEKQERVEAKIQTLFKHTYPDDFETDKIIVNHYMYETYEEHLIYDAYETRYIYNGRITLTTGEIVFDSNENIHHKGLWEDYVCRLADQYALEEQKIQEEKSRAYKLQQQKIKENKQKEYDEKHSYIDDSKLFK